MTIDPWLIVIAATALSLTITGLLFQFLRQSVLVAYLLTGILLGPHVLGVFSDPTVLDPMAGLALVLLLFFIGLEVDLRQLSSRWRVAVLGSLLQTVVSVAVVWLIGQWLNWPLPRIILMGFVITLSSTPVVLRTLSELGLLNTNLGANVLGVLVAQDLLAIPMLIILGVFQGETPSASTLLLQISSMLLIAGVIAGLVRRGGFSTPFASHIENSHEMQVLAALAFCFSMALLTGFMQLSVVLGGFLGGLIARLSNSMAWVQPSLEPFNFALVALFFVSIGVLVDLDFLLRNLVIVIGLTLVALVMNTLINMLTLRVVGESWLDSLRAGASLAQLGEFGFVLAALGLATGVIVDEGYQYVLSVTALSWLLSPAWIIGIEKLSARLAKTA
ncbi:MAG: cation:proton antiporter [Pseudohongiellaceae bacterium]